MPDERGRLVVGDRVWVYEDPDFEADCEAEVVSIDQEEAWIATDPSIPRCTFEDRRFHANFSRDCLMYGRVKLLSEKLKTEEDKLKGVAKFWRRTCTM